MPGRSKTITKNCNMSIRNKALKWYSARYGGIGRPIYTSKYYLPEESWPKKSVWWPQIPVNALNKYSYINILCECSPGQNSFYHLKIPTRYILENLSNFHSIDGKKIDFYFSTDPAKFFIEIRGSNPSDFSIFLQNRF